MELPPLLTLMSIANDADKIRLTFLSISTITFVRFYHTDATKIVLCIVRKSEREWGRRCTMW